jgi:hypothetical protein
LSATRRQHSASSCLKSILKSQDEAERIQSIQATMRQYLAVD